MIGFGFFDLIVYISSITCPNCNSNQIEVINLGFINFIWKYKGILKGQKKS